MAAPTLPTTCKAWQYMSTTGGLEKNLKLNPTAPIPVPTSTQNLVQVIAAGLNPVDYKPAEVGMVSRFAIPKPATPGIEFVGRIITPAKDSLFEPGQLVFGATGTSPFAGGALAQFSVAPKETTVAVPEGVDLVDLVGIAVAGQTAYLSIVPWVKKGDRVLILGGSGGVGTWAVQFAKAVGCHVTTTCSTRNVELSKSLGADEVVDYTKGSVIEAIKASGTVFDHIVDNVGNGTELYWACHKFTKPKVVYLFVAWGPSLETMLPAMRIMMTPTKKRKFQLFFPAANVEHMEQIASWIREGKVRAVTDERFPFEEAPKAYEKLKTKRARGKIIVDVAPEM